jgi:hypothetical protein
MALTVGKAADSHGSRRLVSSLAPFDSSDPAENGGSPNDRYPVTFAQVIATVEPTGFEPRSPRCERGFVGGCVAAEVAPCQVRHDAEGPRVAGQCSASVHDGSPLGSQEIRTERSDVLSAARRASCSAGCGKGFVYEGRHNP